jgi:hypothetical protein
MEDSEKVLNSAIDMINHFEDVERNIIAVSKESSLKIAKLIEDGKVEASDEVVSALQYQDIVSQRLSATIEAMEETKRYLQNYVSDSMCADELLEKLSFTLQNAIKKQIAFEGSQDIDDSTEDDIFF